MSEKQNPRVTPHFRRSELACPCCGEFGMNPRTVERLEAARLIFGAPITIASAYRCPKYNRKIGGGKDSAHPRGTAIDPARPRGGEALAEMISAFMAAGFHGFGMGKKTSKDGRATQNLHFDDDAKLGPRAWMY